MDFQDYLVPGKTGLLIGIGGVSMSPLAEVLHDAGLDIRGSDMSESDNTLTSATAPPTLRMISSS